jgi:hypothetical protein
MALNRLSILTLASVVAGATLGEWSIYCGDSVSPTASLHILLYVCIELSDSLSIYSARMAFLWLLVLRQRTVV